VIKLLSDGSKWNEIGHQENHEGLDHVGMNDFLTNQMAHKIEFNKDYDCWNTIH
jgi:hypothetical protein